MTTYRYSALGSAALRMWRSWTVIVPVVVVNAAVQAVLVRPSAEIGSPAAWTLAVVSGLVVLAGYGLVASSALRVLDGRVGWRTVLRTLREHGPRYAVWAVAWALVVAVGYALWIVPALVVAAVTPFLLLAALDGRPNPLVADLVVVRQRFWRWLVTVLVVGVVGLLGFVLVALMMFFVRGSVGAFVVWLVGGLVGAWITVTWALIYRSVDAGAGAGGPADAAGAGGRAGVARRGEAPADAPAGDVA